MSKFDDWFHQIEGCNPRSMRCYDEIEDSRSAPGIIREWLEAAYNQGFQDGYNSPMPPTDFV